MASKLGKLFVYSQLSKYGSETYYLERVMEAVRRKKAAYYSRHPELLVEVVRKIAEDFPAIIIECGKTYFTAFAAGVLAERYGISIAAANKALSIWNKKE